MTLMHARISGRQSAFTLAEMAVVVLLIGILATMGLKMAIARLDNAAFSDTKAREERIKVALISYLRSNAKLPCPDIAGPPTGSAPTTCPNLASAYGVIPWATLGLSRADALDGWGNYFSYRVANAQSTAKDWTNISVPNSFTIAEYVLPSSSLTVQELNAAQTALTTITNKAVVAIVSHGKNGYGAMTSTQPTRRPLTGAGTDEATNATTPFATFVVRAYTDNPSAYHGAYDDVVTYLTASDLLQPLVSEKTIPAVTCTSYCAPGTCPASPGNLCTATPPIGGPINFCSCIAGLPVPY